jgi:hypothetical protein
MVGLSAQDKIQNVHRSIFFPRCKAFSVSCGQTLKVRRRENAVKGEQRGKKEAHASNYVKRSPVRKYSVKERRISARNNTEK